MYRKRGKEMRTFVKVCVKDYDFRKEVISILTARSWDKQDLLDKQEALSLAYELIYQFGPIPQDVDRDAARKISDVLYELLAKKILNDDEELEFLNENYKELTKFIEETFKVWG